MKIYILKQWYDDKRSLEGYWVNERATLIKEEADNFRNSSEYRDYDEIELAVNIKDFQTNLDD